MDLRANLEALAGALLFVVSNSALAALAYRTAARALPGAGVAVRVTATVQIILSLVVGIAQTLGTFSSFHRVPVALLCLFLAGIGAIALPGAPSLGADLARIRQALRAFARGPGAALLAAACLALGLAVRRGLAIPPLGWDSLTYHLVFAAHYVQSGSLSPIRGPFVMDHYAFFPKNGEILAAWLMLPFHGDLLVGVLNVGLLIAGAIATFALARETGAGLSDAALTAALICLSPFVLAFATTQNVDTLVFVALVSGALFVLRFWLRGAPADATLALMALGLAAGTKFTALALVGILGIALCVAATRYLAAGAHGRHMALALSFGAVLAASVGSLQYVRNALELGNPIYPLELRIAGHEVLRGSPYTEAMAAEKGASGRSADLAQIQKTFDYYPDWRTPTSAGPKFLLLIPLALLATFRAPASSRGALRLLVVSAGFAMVAAYAPGEGFPALSRRFWPGSAPRFLIAPLALFTVVALAFVRGLAPARAGVLRGILLAFAFWDLLEADETTPAAFALLTGGFAAAVSVAVALLPERAWTQWRRTRVAAPLLLVLGVCSALVLLERHRSSTRWHHYAQSTDVHAIPQEFVDGWRLLDNPSAPHRIALVAGWEHVGQNWFTYPLLGRYLQNTVVYVPLHPDDEPSTRRQVLRVGGRYEDWLGALRVRGVERVFVQAPWPVEDGWMAVHPESFAVVAGGPLWRIYEAR